MRTRRGFVGTVDIDSQRADEIATVCLGTGSDDACLGEHVVWRGDLSNGRPDSVDVGPPFEGAIAVGKDRQQVGTRVERLGGLELLDGLTPAAQPVADEAGHLVDGGNPWDLPQQRGDRPAGVVEAVTLEGISASARRWAN